MQSCAILVLSCDKYSDLWKPFFYQFWKYWPDCPYPVYLGSNMLSYTKDKRVKTILSGQDKDWSTSLLAILQKIKEEYIFIWLDDIFPISLIDNSIMETCFTFLKKPSVKHIHYRLKPPPDSFVPGTIFGKYDKGAPYRANTIGFWEKKSLLRYLLPGESPWNFEIYGSYRSSYDEGFYGPTRCPFDFIHVVEKGKYHKDAVVYCYRHHIPLDIQKRSIILSKNRFKSKIQVYFFNTMLKVPWKWRVGLMSILRKFFISY